MHVQIAVATFELPDTVIEVDHWESGECFEAARMLGMGLGKCVVDDSAQLQRFAPVAALFDPAAGVGKHAHINAVFIHDIEIFLLVEFVKAYAANIASRLLGHEFKKFCWKGMKMRIDNHVGSFLLIITSRSAGA
jgi:hypothetical protein